MNEFITAPAIMTSLGLFFGIILAVAYKLLKVEEDPRLAHTEELLPGTNCGACGEPGCLPFAQKLLTGEVQVSSCTVASSDEIDEIADYLGVDAGEAEKRVARLRCAGGKAQAFQIAEYDGFESCRAAAVISGGGKGCSWGCLGLADCDVACDFDAIHMNDNGLPVVDSDKCTACGDCVEACPKDLFVLMPIEQKLIVQCKNLLKGDAAEDLCSVACNTCNRCVADSEPGVIEMIDNLAVINYEKNELTDPKAILRCPTKAIVWVEGQQFVDSSIELEKEVV